MSRSTRSKSKFLIVATQQTVTNSYDERKFESVATLNKLTNDVKDVLKPGRPVLVRLSVSGEGHSFVVRITDDGLEYIDHVDAGFVPIEVNNKRDHRSHWWEVGYFINRLADGLNLPVSCVPQDPELKATKVYKKKDREGVGPCALYAGLFLMKTYGISSAEVASLLPPESDGFGMSGLAELNLFRPTSTSQATARRPYSSQSSVRAPASASDRASSSGTHLRRLKKWKAQTAAAAAAAVVYTGNVTGTAAYTGTGSDDTVIDLTADDGPGNTSAEFIDLTED